MKQKLLKMLLVMMILVMAFVVGCSKTDKDQITNTEVVVKETEATTAKEKVAEAEGLETKEGNDSEAENTMVEGGIKDVYTQYGIQTGTCLSEAMIAVSKYTDLITENYNQVTLENYMKPDYVLSKSKSIATGELSVEFAKKTTDLLDWAKNSGMLVRGHTLVWYSQTPDWIFYEDFDKTKGLVDRETMLERMESYIKQSFEQLDILGYTDIFYAYDVVNEAIMEDGSYRDCLWKQIIGDDYIWHAFNYADQYAPESVKLYYNDYNEQFKTNSIVKLAQSLVDEDGRSLIDGIGCQGHLYTGDSIDSYMTTLKAFSALGLDVQITELDVSLGTWQNVLSPTDENLKVQGQYYYDLVNRIIEGNAAGTTNVSGITFWGFTDSLSWRKERSPLLFDSNLKPKYAYYGAMQVTQ